MTKLFLLATLALATAACHGQGMGADTRADIAARMAEARSPITDCYADALKSNRKLKGMVIIDFTAEAGTGEFKNIRFGRDEVNDTPIRQCILAELGKLKLATAPKSNVEINYPFRFAPNN